jgi:hypothetical protein
VDHDGKQQGWIALTESVRDALYDLWEAPGITSKRFWIDQVCINQDGDEKNHQVAMMGDIYANASNVILYLGSEDDDANTAEQGAQLLENLHEHCKPNLEFFERKDLMAEIRQSWASCRYRNCPWLSKDIAKRSGNGLHVWLLDHGHSVHGWYKNNS